MVSSRIGGDEVVVRARLRRRTTESCGRGVVARCASHWPTGRHLAAIVVAFLFAPVRSLIQRMINRAFYGTRSDPARTASRIGEGLRQDDDLPGVLQQTRSALRLPWISLRGEPGGNDIATAGTLQESPTVEMPLTYRGEQVGTLVVGLRRGEHDLHDADRRTLDLIATPLAVALHATALSDQVQQARTATVEAAAAERVRLQRELHDGVGPILTSAAFQADAASNLIHTDPDGAERLIDEIRIELRGAIDDVRQVVYGLRSHRARQRRFGGRAPAATGRPAW